MSYVQTVIRPDEKILATGHMHWIVYARSASARTSSRPPAMRTISAALPMIG
jgi:hypothetical protein